MVEDSIRFGLAAVKNVGEGAIESIVDGAHGRTGVSRRSSISAPTSICAG